jgi:hypothetical protein
MDNRFFMKIPGRSVSWTTFTDVFEKYFWLVLAGMVIILSLAFYMESSCIKDGIKVDLPTSATTVLLSLIGLSIPISDPKRLSLRVLLISTCITAAVIFWGFQVSISPTSH